MRQALDMGSWGQTGSVEELDRERRAANTRAAAYGIAGCALTFALVRLLAHDPLSTVAVGGSVTLLALLALLTARRGHLDLAALLLVATPQVAVLGVTALRGQMLSAGTMLLLSPLLAGLLSTPRGVAVSLLTSLLTQRLALLLERGAGPPLAPELAVINTLLLLILFGLLSLLSAVTAERALAEALRRERAGKESDRLYRVVAEQMTDLIGLVDCERRFLFASPSFERVLGIAPQELLGTRCDDLIHPADRQAASVVWDAALQRRSAQTALRLRHANGNHHWVELHLDASHRDGELAVAISARDIDQRRALESQVREAQKQEAIGRMAGGLAHDLKNLLLVIDVSCEALEPVVPEGHEARLDLEALREASQRANQLTRQLLAFARRERAASVQPIDLGQGITQVTGLLSRVLGPSVRLRVELAPDLGRVAMEPGQLEQILLNLASNARDAMPRGGTVTVRARRRKLGSDERLPPGDYAELSVTDTGSGMPPEVLAHLFEPFFTTKSPGQGTGLGLASSYSSMLQIGGLLTVESAPEVGSTFTLLIPHLGSQAAEQPVHLDSALS